MANNITGGILNIRAFIGTELQGSNLAAFTSTNTQRIYRIAPNGTITQYTPSQSSTLSFLTPGEVYAVRANQSFEYPYFLPLPSPTQQTQAANLIRNRLAPPLNTSSQSNQSPAGEPEDVRVSLVTPSESSEPYSFISYNPPTLANEEVQGLPIDTTLTLDNTQIATIIYPSILIGRLFRYFHKSNNQTYINVFNGLPTLNLNS